MAKLKEALSELTDWQQSFSYFKDALFITYIAKEVSEWHSKSNIPAKHRKVERYSTNDRHSEFSSDDNLFPKCKCVSIKKNQ